MQKLVLVLLLLCCFTSCKSTKRIAVSSEKTEHISNKKNAALNLAERIVENAKAYNGVKYKYGGITNRGMDCSGLVYLAFKKENVMLPRVSEDMAMKGIPITLTDVKKGDLLFFQTSKSNHIINHVGLVTTSGIDSIEFIHSTTGKGVIVSSLDESYWHSAFVEARRVL